MSARLLGNPVRAGKVGALVVDGPESEPRVYTIKTAVEPYRLLIEQMAQGALMVSRDGYILYCNALREQNGRININ